MDYFLKIIYKSKGEMFIFQFFIQGTSPHTSKHFAYIYIYIQIYVYICNMYNYSNIQLQLSVQNEDTSVGFI